MRDLLTTHGEIVGALLASFGLALHWPWLGVTIFGIALVAFSYMAAE